MTCFSSQGQYIVAGSDDGSFFIWDRHTTNIMRVLRGDDSIVNCLQPHPSYCLLATSGIDPVVRLWSPRPEVMMKHIHPLSLLIILAKSLCQWWAEKPAGKYLSLICITEDIGSNSSIFNLYFKGAWFRSHQGHCLPWLRFFMVYLSPGKCCFLTHPFQSIIK